MRPGFAVNQSSRPANNLSRRSSVGLADSSTSHPNQSHRFTYIVVKDEHSRGPGSSLQPGSLASCISPHVEYAAISYPSKSVHAIHAGMKGKNGRSGARAEGQHPVRWRTTQWQLAFPAGDGLGGGELRMSPTASFKTVVSTPHTHTVLPIRFRTQSRRRFFCLF